MQIVQPNQNFCFNYTDPFQRSGLFVRFSVYDVTSGTPFLIQNLVGNYNGNGSYSNVYSSASGKVYLVVGLVYTDGTYMTVDTTAAQTSETYNVLASEGSFECFFSYASVDYNNSLFIRAQVWDLTTGTAVSEGTVNLTSIANGIYIGSFAGITGHTYSIISVVYTDGSYSTPDLGYSPASPVFSAILPAILITGTAHLIGQGQGQTGIITVNPPIHFTQGDDALLQLIAVDVYGNPVNLSDASFSTQISGANGQPVNVFQNSQHTANPDQVNFQGYFTLVLSESDTASCGEGDHKEILTTITIDGNQIYFRGFNALQVYEPTPFA